jgi:hypothetical protein
VAEREDHGPLRVLTRDEAYLIARETGLTAAEVMGIMTITELIAVGSGGWGEDDLETPAADRLLKLGEAERAEGGTAG